jgi:hypothetical protein
MGTTKLKAWTRLISKVIWLLVVLIVLAGVGRWLLWPTTPKPSSVNTIKPVPAPPIDWDQVDKEVRGVLTSAGTAAESSAMAKLDAWVESLRHRVDDDFLSWYFSYWNQQVLGLKGIWYWSVKQVMDDRPDAAERITEDIQEEFAKRVLRPQVAQLQLERITTEVLEVYISELSKNLSRIPEKYRIPQPDWERYLNDIAVVASGTEGNREIPLTLKAVMATTAGGGVVVAKAFAPTVRNIGGKLSGKLAEKAAGKVAGKTGAKVAGKAGGKLLGPIIGFGIIIWDVWDHYETKKVERPILRQTIVDYFTEVKQSLLYEPESGIMAIIRTMEGNIVATAQTQYP